MPILSYLNMPILRSSTRHPDQLFTSANQGHWKFSIVVMDQSVLEVIEKSGYISSSNVHLIIVGHEGAPNCPVLLSLRSSKKVLYFWFWL